jgi:hypothetical protein
MAANVRCQNQRAAFADVMRKYFVMAGCLLLLANVAIATEVFPETVKPIKS